MEALREYILSIVAAAVLCAVLGCLAGHGTTGAVFKLVSGLVLALCVLSPLVKLSFDGVLDRWETLFIDGQAAAAAGTAYADENLRERISSQTQAYILDKAQALGLELEVEILLSDGDIPTPAGAVLTGNTSPYAKNVIQTLLTDELGIPREAQTWK